VCGRSKRRWEEEGHFQARIFLSLRWCSKRTRQPTLLRRIHHSLAQFPRAAVELLADDVPLAHFMPAFMLAALYVDRGSAFALQHFSLTRFNTPMTSREPHRPLTCKKVVLYMAACTRTNLACCPAQHAGLLPIGLQPWDIGRLGEGRVVPALSRSFANGRQHERAMYGSLCPTGKRNRGH
jgi:hypothetical protein